VSGFWYSFRYVDYGLILAAPSGAYLALRSHMRIHDGEQFAVSQPFSQGAAVVVFFLFLTISVVILSLTLYGRAWVFFLLAAIMSGVLTFQIISFAHAKRTRNLLLGQVFALFLILRLSLFEQYPSSVLGVDPWYHLSFLMSILDSGHIPIGSTYSGFPGMHLAVITFSQITQMNAVASFVLTLMGFEFVGFVFTFMLAELVTDTRVALLATLLLTILQTSVRWGWWLTPTTIGVSIMPLLVYALLRKTGQHAPYRFIIILLLASVIIIHEFSTFVLFVIMAALYVALRLSHWREREKRAGSSKPIGLSGALLLLFAVAFFSYWVYASGPFGPPFVDYVLLAVRFGFRINIRQIFAPDLSFFDWAVTRTGVAILEALSILGLLLMICPRHGDWKKFSVALSGLTVMGVTLVVQVLGLEALLPVRWMPFAQYLTIMAASLALFSLTRFVRRFGFRRLLLIALVSSIAFMNVMAPEASFDSPFATDRNSHRYALTTSEMAGADLITRIYQGPILTDVYFADYPSLFEANAEHLTPDSIPTSSPRHPGLFLLREYVLLTGLPVYTSTAEGFIRLPPGYEDLLSSNAHWSRVYSSNALSGYLTIT